MVRVLGGIAGTVLSALIRHGPTPLLRPAADFRPRLTLSNPFACTGWYLAAFPGLLTKQNLNLTLPRSRFLGSSHAGGTSTVCRLYVQVDFRDRRVTGVAVSGRQNSHKQTSGQSRGNGSQIHRYLGLRREWRFPTTSGLPTALRPCEP